MRQSLTKKSGKNLTVIPEPRAKQTDEVKSTYGTAQVWRLGLGGKLGLGGRDPAAAGLGGAVEGAAEAEGGLLAQPAALALPPQSTPPPHPALPPLAPQLAEP
jgi:hypothetical protein